MGFHLHQRLLQQITVEDRLVGGALIFGIISLIMALIALILMQVNSNLKKLSDDTEGILRPNLFLFIRIKFI
jgi:hypothetical protein